MPLAIGPLGLFIRRQRIGWLICLSIDFSWFWLSAFWCRNAEMLFVLATLKTRNCRSFSQSDPETVDKCFRWSSHCRAPQKRARNCAGSSTSTRDDDSHANWDLILILQDFSCPLLEGAGWGKYAELRVELRIGKWNILYVLWFYLIKRFMFKQ